MLCFMPTGFRLLILSPTHPPMVRASPGRHVTFLTPGPTPGHHVTTTPGLSHRLFAGSPRIGPPAPFVRIRLVPGGPAPCTGQPYALGPHRVPYPLPSSPCRIRAIGATLLASSIGSKPPCFGVKPHVHWVKPSPRSLPSCKPSPRIEASEATLHASGQTPSLVVG